MLAKDAGDEKGETIINLQSVEPQLEKWKLEEPILPRVIDHFDHTVDPSHVEEQLFSEIMESRKERAEAKDRMEDDQDRDDDLEEADDHSEVDTVELMDEEFLALPESIFTPPSFNESPQRNLTRTYSQSRTPSTEVRGMDGRSQSSQQRLTDNFPGRTYNHNPGARVRFAPHSTHISYFPPSNNIPSAEVPASRWPSHLHATMAPEQNRISTFANPDPYRIRPAGTVAPRDMEIPTQSAGLSLFAPGTPRYPTAARLGNIAPVVQ